VLNAPESAKVLVNEGANVVASTPSEFAAYLNAEVLQWTKVVHEAGIKAD
jgi:tripartite-type tricarboxylate transporter receptor subunit TctC